ncbi:ABC transporter permease [bacterium]|nr:ABC transporter permease [bacterium]
MLYWQTLVLAFRGLSSNRFRTFLTTLGIIIGVMSVITMLSISMGVRADIISRFSDFGVTDMGFYINHDNSATRIPRSEKLTLADGEAIKDQCSAVDAISPFIDGEVRVKFGEMDAGQMTIYGVDEGWFNIPVNEIETGEPISREHNLLREPVCVLAVGMVEKLFYNAPPLGQMIRLNGRRFRVVGILEHRNAWGQNEFIVVPYFTGAERLGMDGTLTYDASAHSMDHVNLAVSQIRELVHSRHPRLPVDPEAVDREQPIRIWTRLEWKKEAEQEIKEIGNLLVTMGSLALFIGGIGVMNIMIFNVRERTPEIGLRKALGATSRQIMGQFLAEAMAMTMFGGAVGSMLAFLICTALSKLPGDINFPEPQVTPLIVFLAVSMSVGTGLFFGVWPASQAAALQPMEALRHE